MSEIQNTYPVFESNQVLTSAQLNSLVNYLDQQNRLTRAKLIGMGVVCGLQIDYSKTNRTITISKGTGITSEGYLINLGDCETVKYRPYKLPPGTIYEPFVGADNRQDINLWELLTSAADDGPDVKTLDNETFLADKVVLLFIESFDKDLKSCLGKSCDELGKQRILTVRKLLISKTDLQKVWNRTNTGKLDAVFDDKFQLPVINMPRVLFDPEKPHSSDYEAFSKSYANAVLLVFDDLFKALNQTWEIYRPLLDDLYNEENPFESSRINLLINKLQNFLNGTGGGDPYLGVQYVYDLFTDLIRAYNEFKNTAFDLMSECCPDMDRFPKHLMLGEVVTPALSVCEKSEYRHHFVQPPVYNLQKLLVQKTISNHNRMVMMLESFELSRINVVSDKFVPKITPSLEKTTPQGNRSIPWYYDVNRKSGYPKLGNLKSYWNFDVSRKCPDEKDGLVLNYDDQDNDQSAAKKKLLTPLYYDIEDYSFFRIEGYIGKKVEEVATQLEKLREQFDLPFKTVTLRLSKKAGTGKPDFNCGFNDIQEEYFAARNNLKAFMNGLYGLYYSLLKKKDLTNTDDEQVKQFLVGIDKLYELLSNLEKSLPDCVSNFDLEAFQDEYKTILQFVLKFFIIEMDFAETMTEGSILDEVKKTNLKVLPVTLLDWHLYNRFFGLYHSLKRREFHLSKKSDLFSGFLKKHPGISHGAGVPKGGTFILLAEEAETPRLIADFYLPYLCCTQDNCIPLCEGKDGFRLDIKPFARPDFAVTERNQPVEIDVMRNDFNLFGGQFSVKTSENSEQGGKIRIKNNRVQFKPADDFTGYDTFKYQLINEVNQLSDEGEVVVLVKGAAPAKTCYTVEILECWGIQRVSELLKDRGISVPPGSNRFELLLGSLRSTGGFREEEITGGILEDEQARRDLVNCLGIPTTPNTTYDELAEMIRTYQKLNCRGSVKECFTLAILECWGAENVKQFVSTFNINGTGSDEEKMLQYLRSHGGFLADEMNWLLETGTMLPLLKCINPDVPDNLNNEQMKVTLTAYQSANCLAFIPGEVVEVVPGTLARNEMIAVLGSRGISVSGNEPDEIVESRFRESARGENLTKDEVNILPKKSIMNILKSKGIAVAANDTKDVMIKKLFNG